MGKRTPRKWQYVPIKELYRGLYDGPHATPAPSDSGPIFLGIKNIGEDGSIDLTDIRHIAEEDFPRWTKRVTPKCGDIVFSYEATLHRYALIPTGFRGCLGRRMALIRVNPECCDYKFLFFYLRSSLWRQVIESKQVIGATVDRIPLIKFPDFPVLAPDLHTQQKIASILSAYDDLIENNKRRIAILEKMAEEIYREWFVRMRFPASAKATAGKPAENIRGLPSGWMVKELREVATVNATSLGKRNLPETIHYIDISGVSTNKIDSISQIPASEAPGRARRLVQHGDIIWSSVRPANRAYCLILNPVQNLVVSTGFAVIRSKGRLPFSYLYFALTTDAFVEQMSLVAKGSAYPATSFEDFERAKLIIPTEEQLKWFDEVCLPMLKEKENLLQQNQVLCSGRDLLLPRLISGKLSVENLELPSNEKLASVSSALPQQELAHA